MIFLEGNHEECDGFYPLDLSPDQEAMVAAGMTDEMAEEMHVEMYQFDRCWTCTSSEGEVLIDVSTNVLTHPTPPHQRLSWGGVGG